MSDFDCKVLSRKGQRNNITMSTKITLESIKSSSYYNCCYPCGNKKDLNECNNCLELYCTACDLLLYNWCSFCKYRHKRKK